VAPHNTSFLNDIVVDTDRNIAYITDTSGGGGLVVYYMATNSARRWVSPTMAVESLSMRIAGVDYGSDNFTAPVDGIALSRDFSTLYYCPLHGLSLYSIQTAHLQAGLSDADLDAKVGREVLCCPRATARP
jgi:sugar lactone lactonase YvrE